MHAKLKRPWMTLRDCGALGTAAVIIFVIFPWLDGRAPRIGDVTIFAIVVLSPVVHRWLPNMPSFLPADYSSTGENLGTPRLAYVVVGVGLLIALAMIFGVLASIDWMG
jgi:hypothetical protein